MSIPPTPPELIGQAPVFQNALAHASNAAALNRPLLIVGERGVGKELFAARVHFLSARWDGPLVKVNCAAMNEDLLESELFGHEAGAFTGATRKHHGRFERAEGGTLFLDEIASASLRVQEKLLRVIEYGEYERVGGETTLTADVRIVAAANVDLPKAAAAGRFRADLLDRLSFDVIAAPPMRERADDIPLLAAHFAQGLAVEIDTPFPGFGPSALADLLGHDWPGNVRELKNVAERSFYRWVSEDRKGPVDQVILNPFPTLASTPPIPTDPDDASLAPGRDETDAKIALWKHAVARADSPRLDLRTVLDEVEKSVAGDYLERFGGNQSKTANALGLTYDQMRGIVRKYELISD